MSLILEALRKSEVERRRGAVPDLMHADTPVATARDPALSPLWWAAVLVPLAVLLALAAWRRDAPVAPAPMTSAVAAATTPVAAPAPPVLPPVAHLRAPPARPVPKPIDIAPAPEALAAQASTPAATPSPATPPRPGPAQGTGPVPLSTLPRAQRQALPPLRLSMHLWNPDPARRVAILDGQRVADGDRVGEAVVAEISRTGVVLDWNGRQVLVPLP